MANLRFDAQASRPPARPGPSGLGRRVRGGLLTLFERFRGRSLEAIAT